MASYYTDTRVRCNFLDSENVAYEVVPTIASLTITATRYDGAGNSEVWTIDKDTVNRFEVDTGVLYLNFFGSERVSQYPFGTITIETTEEDEFQSPHDITIDLTSSGTTRVWSSNLDTDASDGLNYTPIGIIEADSDLIFNGTGSAAAVDSGGSIEANTIQITDASQNVTLNNATTLHTGIALVVGTLGINDVVTIGSEFAAAALSTFAAGPAASIVVQNAGFINTGGHAMPPIEINANTAINDGCTITSVTCGTDGITVTWEEGETFTITALAAANWNGAAGSLNAFRSSVPGTQYTIDIPNAETMEYMNPQDCVLTGFEITVDDGTSADGGNNEGWIFPEGMKSKKLYKMHKIHRLIYA